MSNSYPHSIEVGNVKAKTVEHYFQASKFLESNAQLAQAVLDTPTPREARDLAHANKTTMTPQQRRKL